jgi:hypothetical protein
MFNLGPGAALGPGIILPVMRLNAELRAEILRSFGEKPWNQNPFVTIGLSPSILNLNLNDKQLFKIVHSYARQLVAAVHPDNNDKADKLATNDTITRIMVAFNWLNDERTFFYALDEFKTLKSLEKDEINHMQIALTNAREEIDILNSKIAELNSQIRQRPR